MDDSEEETREELRRITPSNAELLESAKRFPPPQSWYDEGEDEWNEDLFEGP